MHAILFEIYFCHWIAIKHLNCLDVGLPEYIREQMDKADNGNFIKVDMPFDSIRN